MLLCAASPLNQYSQELSSWQAIFHLQQNASNAFYAINFIMVYAHLQPMSQNKNNAVRLNSTAENEYLMDRKKQQCFETEQGMQTLGNIFQQFCQCSSVLTGNNSAILHYQDLFFVNSLKCFFLFCFCHAQMEKKDNAQKISQGIKLLTVCPVQPPAFKSELF